MRTVTIKDLTIEIYAFNFEILLICFAFVKLAAKIKKKIQSLTAFEEHK